MVIPAEIVALITLPGVILHEIAHRLFCDINDVDVYEIKYFNFLSRKAGHVVHAGTPNFGHALLISIAPLIVNTLVCMLLTFPYGIKVLLGTDFVQTPSIINHYLQLFILWIGYSVGFNAIPSNQDMANLLEVVPEGPASALLSLFIDIVALFNVDLIGGLLQGLYAYAISLVLPSLFLILLKHH